MLDIGVICLHVLGVIFFIGTIIGINRLPDFYSRMHAASKGDTLSSLCLLGGFALYALHDFNLESINLAAKIIFIIIFIFVSSPTASHVLAEAAYKTVGEEDEIPKEEE